MVEPRFVRYSIRFARVQMAQTSETILPSLIRTHESRILSDWMTAQLQSIATRRDLMNETDLRRESRDFLAAFTNAAEQGGLTDIHGPAWTHVREMLSRLSRSRALQGFSPSETATFV